MLTISQNDNDNHNVVDNFSQRQCQSQYLLLLLHAVVALTFKKKCIQYSALGAIAQLSIIAIKSFPILEEFPFSHLQNYSVLIRGTIGTIADIL